MCHGHFQNTMPPFPHISIYSLINLKACVAVGGVHLALLCRILLPVLKKHHHHLVPQGSFLSLTENDILPKQSSPVLHFCYYPYLSEVLKFCSFLLCMDTPKS